jgi:hypothetical protein
MRLEVADGCYLRLLEEADAEELYELVDRNRDYLAEWMPWAAAQTLEGTAAFKVRCAGTPIATASRWRSCWRSG